MQLKEEINNIWDFLETAAIIANCDLVISSDTAIAHLAGGMNKRTWLMLKKIPEWRWGLKGETTFWYPSVKLFRQKHEGNWQELITRIVNELQEASRFNPSVKDPTLDLSIKKTSKQYKYPSIKVSPGELIDKITILQIQKKYSNTPFANDLEAELHVLEQTLHNLRYQINEMSIEKLSKINSDLWSKKEIADKYWQEEDIGEDFAALLKHIYQQNKLREAVIESINRKYYQSEK